MTRLPHQGELQNNARSSTLSSTLTWLDAALLTFQEQSCRKEVPNKAADSVVGAADDR